MANSALWTSEEDPSEDTDSELEVSSDNKSSDSYLITPTTVLFQPPPTNPAPEPSNRGPRTIQTARKRIAPPIRSGITIPRPITAEPSLTLTGVPIARVAGMTPEEARRVQTLESDFRTYQHRVARHDHAILKLSELAHLMEECTFGAVEKAVAAARAARRMELCCQVVAILVAMLILAIVILVCLGY